MYLLPVRCLIVWLQDKVLHRRIRLVDGLRGHLDVGSADVGVVDRGLECAVWPRFRDERADEAFVCEALL